MLSYALKEYGEIDDDVFTNVIIFCKYNVRLDEPVGAVLIVNILLPD
jgi:hypothetical protein